MKEIKFLIPIILSAAYTSSWWMACVYNWLAAWVLIVFSTIAIALAIGVYIAINWDNDKE